MAIVISGKELSKVKRAAMKEQVALLKEKYGRAPSLAVLLVGNDPASESYVAGKSRVSTQVGIDNVTVHLEETATEEEVINEIKKLNNDPNVDAILVQLPLPRGLNERIVIDNIDPAKDVDGFHIMNVGGLYEKMDVLKPCTPLGVIEMLDSINYPIEGKHAVVIGRSNVVGMPCAKMLLDRNATVTICHSRTKNIKEIARQADILVAAVGKPYFVTEDMVKEGACVIDVGVNQNSEGKLCGDVDFENVEKKAEYITKVPGGTGPMTITCLMENTIKCFLNRMGEK